MSTKLCKSCQVVKDVHDYSQNGNSIRSVCKSCRNAKAKEYRKANIEAHREKDKQYYEANREIRLENNKQYRLSNRENICLQKKQYYNDNKECIALYNSGRKTIRNLKKKERRYNDSVFRVVEAMKVRIHRVLKSQKNASSDTYIGCSSTHLKLWLEFQFNKNMSWDNYGEYWHIDHVIPIASFDVNDEHNKMVCFHWSNVRPLEKAENISKSDKILVHQVLAHNDTLHKFIQYHGYQTLPEKAWWLRKELRYGNNPEDDFVTWMTHEMGNPQPSS